jgi:ABC-type amino acid transport substrate-binding protein
MRSTFIALMGLAVIAHAYSDASASTDDSAYMSLAAEKAPAAAHNRANLFDWRKQMMQEHLKQLANGQKQFEKDVKSSVKSERI